MIRGLATSVALALLLAALPERVSPSPATGGEYAAFVTLFACPPEAEAALFPGATMARVVLDSHSYFTAASARDLVAGLGMRSADEFALVSGTISYGSTNTGERRISKDGSGFGFAWSPRSASVRVTLCELARGYPTGVRSAVSVRARDALLVKVTLNGLPCVAVMRVTPIDPDQSKDTEEVQAYRAARDAFLASVRAMLVSGIDVSPGEASPDIKKFLANVR